MDAYDLLDAVDTNGSISASFFTQMESKKWLNRRESTQIDHYVDILCESIKKKDVNLSILALQTFKNIIESDHINSRCLQLITDAVTKIEFTSKDSELVEEGFHQAIRVCCSLVKCRKSYELTNGSVSEIIIFSFRVVNSKLVLWLRSKAARTLISITKILFRRLVEFPEDPCLKPSYQIRLRLGGTSSQSTFKELADQSSANDNNSLTTSSTLRIINERNQPYNLAFMNDFFCYLASLINPDNEIEHNKASEDKILLGLKLLRSAFNEASTEIGQKSCLIYTTRNNICYNIVSILKTTRSIPIIRNALYLASDIFIELRYHLKYQFEAFLKCLIEMLAAKSDQYTESGSYSSSQGLIQATLELRSDVLSTVLELFRNIRHFPYELYYNYDCDPYSSNIYNNLVQICSKNCFPPSLETHFTAIQLASFKCLLTNLADIYSIEAGRCEYLVLDSSLIQNDQVVHCNKSFDFQKISERFPRTYSDLNEAKKRKHLLIKAIEEFNISPKKGIQAMKDNKFITTNEELVRILKDNPEVDKKLLGEYLSKEENKLFCEAFINSLDFTNLRIDEAIRFMLEKFRLPGENQLIVRIFDAFASHYFEQNPGVFRTVDETFTLAFGTLMLNFDRHCQKFNRFNSPMTCDQFDRNLLDKSNARIYDRKLMDLIYTSICENEIVLPDEQVGLVRQRYLWKCTMVKSERIDALYWISTNFASSEEQQQPAFRAEQQTIDGLFNSHSNERNNNSLHLSSHSLPPMETAYESQDKIEANNLPGATVLVINESCLNYANSGDYPSSLPTNINDNQMLRLPLIEMNKILFEIMWSPTVAALKFIFDKIDTDIHKELSKRIVDQGFIKFSHLCAQHGHLDNLVVSLCEFSTDLNSIPHNHSGQTHVMSDKNALAILSLLSIIRDYANCMRDSWPNIFQLILHWYRSRCIDGVQVDDFALQQKIQLRMREIKKSPSTVNQQSSFFSNLSSIVAGFVGPQPAENSKVQNGTNLAPSTIQVLIQTIQDAKYCQESLIELITALTTASIDGDAEEVEDADAFKLEIFTQVILNNKDEAMSVWPRIRAYFVRQSSLCGRNELLGERIVSAAFRVAIQFKPKPEVFSLLSHIIATLDAEIIRRKHTFIALMTLTELHAPNVSMDAKELELCFNQVIFPFLDKVLDGSDNADDTLERALNLLSKTFLKHHKILKDLQSFASLWYAILDTMEKYFKSYGSSNSQFKEVIFELVKNMVLVMDNEKCMSDEMKDKTRTKFMFWELNNQIHTDY